METGAMLVDTRPEFQRCTDGEIPGAIVVERNHLEWRLHPESTGRIPEAVDLDVQWIVICDEGYSSSFAAATLQLIGLHRATDVVGGFQRWRAAGLPVTAPGTVTPPRLAPDRESGKSGGSLVDRDEQAIRTLVATWLEASAAGDLPRVLELMADDVVFLAPGRPPMRGRDGFAAASRAMEGKTRFEGTADIQEVRVFGDWAYCWNHLSVTAHPVGGGEPAHVSGPTLSILHRQADGRWVIFRDANMIAPTA